MFCVVGVQVEVVTLIILALLNGVVGVEVVTLIIPALTKCSVWWVQVEVVSQIILALTKCSVWWEYRLRYSL